MQQELSGMAGREVREYTNLSDPRADKKWGAPKGLKERIDDEDVAFKKMVARMQEVAGERGGYLHGRGALDSDDLLYLKEQMEAEEDADRLRRRTEKKAFAAFKKAASLADASHSTPMASIRVEPRARSGIRQQDLVKSIVEVKPKRVRLAGPADKVAPTVRVAVEEPVKATAAAVVVEAKCSGSLLGLAYEGSDDEDESS